MTNTTTYSLCLGLFGPDEDVQTMSQNSVFNEETHYNHHIQANTLSSGAISAERLSSATPLDIESGGTGAHTKEEAIENLGAAHKDHVHSNQNIVMNSVYPVGSIYMTVDPLFEPRRLFGGAWERWAQGRTIIGVGDNKVTNYEVAEEEGGVDSVKLTEAQLPSHTHIQDAHNHGQNAHTHVQDAHNHNQNTHTHTQQAHTHIQNSHKHVGIFGQKTGGDDHMFYWREGDGNGVSKGNYGGIRGTNNKTEVYTGTVTATNQSTTAKNNNTTATNIATTATNRATAATNQSTVAVNRATGGNSAHENRMPYITCYIWRRIA